MIEFFQALIDPNLPFFRYGVITGLLASIPFGIIGTFVVARRISYIAGAISHCALAGVGIGLYLQAAGISWLSPFVGAVIVVLLAAAVLTLVRMYGGQREDSVIGAIWAAGMAIGLLFIAKTPGYHDPMSYLFGNILLTTKSDMFFVAGLDIVVVGVVTIFYNKFIAICFDEEFAHLRGIRTNLFYLILLCLTALTVVMLIRIVGIVMVIALLTLPAATAGSFARTILQMMLSAILFCAFFVFSGLAVGYSLDMPSGPVIIIIATVVYLFVVFFTKIIAYLKK